MKVYFSYVGDSNEQQELNTYIGYC